MQNFFGNYDWYVIQEDIKKSLLDFVDENSYDQQVLYEELFQRFEFEKVKFVQMTRLFI